ncbi:MAG: ABC transporter permease [Pseudomonadota bacterium]
MSGHTLRTKLLRELWHLKGQVLAIALVIGGGVAVCLMSLVNYSSLNATRAEYYTEHRFADVFASLKRAPDHVLQRIAGIPGVSVAAARVEAAAKLDIDGFDDPVSARLISLPDAGLPAVNRLFLRKGRLPDEGRSNEVVLIGSFAEAHGLVPGDVLSAVINGRLQLLTVVGIAESPEFVYIIPPGAMLPDYERYGVLWLPRKALAAAMDMEGAFNSLALQTETEAANADVIDQLDRLLARYGGTGAFDRTEQFSHRFLNDELNQLKTMATVFPLIFMAVAMFLLNVVISRLINTQRDIIAVLKAFGYSNRQIGWHYGQMVLFIAGLGLLIGAVAGLWLGRALGELYMEFYRFPTLLFRISPWWLVLLAVITLLVAWIGGWRSIRAAASLPPAEAMRPDGPIRFRVGPFERALGGIRLSQPSRMILRQLSRRPARTLMSAMGIAMATAIVMVGNFQFDSVALMVHAQFSRVQQQDIAVSLIDPVNQSALYGLARRPGVLYAEGRRLVSARLINGHREWRTALTGIPADARLQFVIDRHLNPVSLPPAGLLLTDFLAAELAVRPGDTLTVEILEGRRRTLEIPVAGTTSEFLGVGAYMRLSELNRSLGDGPLINQALLNIADEQAVKLYRQLRETPGVLAISIRQAMLDSFFDTLARNFLTFTLVNSILGGIIAFGVIYNTLRISLAEKARELASLRVLGYTHNEVAHILLGELAVLLVLGVPMGWLIGQGLAELIVEAMQTELYRVPLNITSQTLGISATVVVISAFVSGCVAWWRLRRLDLVAVLKTRE